MSNADLPVEVINKFKHGFPRDWQEIIQEHVHDKKNFENKSASNAKSKESKKTVNGKQRRKSSGKLSVSKMERSKDGSNQKHSTPGTVDARKNSAKKSDKRKTRGKENENRKADKEIQDSKNYGKFYIVFLLS